MDPSRVKAAVFVSVDFFLSAIANEVYPDVGYQRIFGVKYGDDLGAIVLHAWITLIKHGVVDGAGLYAALSEGCMPKYFEAAIRALPCENHTIFTHTLLAENLFVHIAWDAEMHRILQRMASGSASAVTVPALVL